MPKKSNDSSITVGDIQYSSGVAIGAGARAKVNQTRPVDVAEVVAMLDRLTGLIDTHSGSLGNAAAARDSALAAREEATGPSPRWGKVRDLLTGIESLAGGVSALTNLIDNIRVLIGHG